MADKVMMSGLSFAVFVLSALCVHVCGLVCVQVFGLYFVPDKMAFLTDGHTVWKLPPGHLYISVCLLRIVLCLILFYELLKLVLNV